MINTIQKAQAFCFFITIKLSMVENVYGTTFKMDFITIILFVCIGC